MRLVFSTLTLLVSGVLMTACNEVTPTELTSDQIKSIWTNLFNKYDVQPIFPLGRAVQPGDIFLDCQPTDATPITTETLGKPLHFPVPMLVATVDLRNELEWFYQTRLPYHFIVNAPGTATPTSALPSVSSSTTTTLTQSLTTQNTDNHNGDSTTVRARTKAAKPASAAASAKAPASAGGASAPAAAASDAGKTPATPSASVASTHTATTTASTSALVTSTSSQGTTSVTVTTVPASQQGIYGSFRAPAAMPIMVAFPDVGGSYQMQKGGSIAIPIGVAEVKAGSSSFFQSYYFVHMANAEMLEIPLYVLQAGIQRAIAEKKLVPAALTPENLPPMACPERHAPALVITGTTYHTRNITVATGETRASAFQALASLRAPTGSTQAATGAALGAASAPVAVSISVNATSTYTAAASQAVTGALQQAGLFPSGANPTVSFSSGAGNSQSLAMAFNFNLPLAFGARIYKLALGPGGSAVKPITTEPDHPLQPMKPLPITTPVTVKPITETPTHPLAPKPAEK